MRAPQLWVVAGPNGAGKSTLVDRHIRGKAPIINPDVIALMLEQQTGRRNASLAAGKLALQQRARLLADRHSFVIETTLTGRSELELMEAALAAGFKISLVYIGLDDIQISIARVQERIRRGGHAVPYGDLIRRYHRSLGQLEAAMAKAHRVLLFDNSGRHRRFVYSSESGRTKFASPHMPDWAPPQAHR